MGPEERLRGLNDEMTILMNAVSSDEFREAQAAARRMRELTTYLAPLVEIEYDGGRIERLAGVARSDGTQILVGSERRRLAGIREIR